MKQQTDEAGVRASCMKGCCTHQVKTKTAAADDVAAADENHKRSHATKSRNKTARADRCEQEFKRPTTVRRQTHKHKVRTCPWYPGPLHVGEDYVTDDFVTKNRDWRTVHRRRRNKPKVRATSNSGSRSTKNGDEEATRRWAENTTMEDIERMDAMQLQRSMTQSNAAQHTATQDEIT